MTSDAASVEAMLTELVRLAEIASVLLDGEEVARIITDDAMHYVVHPRPEHPFLAGDHYDVDHDLFLRTKKLLLRIARLSKLDVGMTVLVPVPEISSLTVALHNGTHFRYYREFGQLSLPATPQLSEVLDSGQIVSIGPDDSLPLATAIGPIRDSLGDVVGVIEMTATVGDEQVAWS